MFEANIDFMNGQQAQGDVASLLMANGRLDAGRLRPYVDSKTGKAYVTVFIGGDSQDPKNYKSIQINAATLRREEWMRLDETVQQIARERLGGVEDLIQNGLVYNLGNGMGTTVLEHHSVSDAFEAELSMDGLSRGKNDRPNYEAHYLPIPIIHVDYQINMRVLSASRSLGNPLDTTSAEIATRKVMEKLEAMLFTNQTFKFGAGTIYSYLNFPQRNQVSLGTAWDDASKTPKQIVDDVLAVKQASIEKHRFGPWMLYIPTAYETVLDEDYDTTRGNTIRQRILAISGVKGIKVIDTLPADNVLLVQMTSDTVRLVRGMGVQNVQWKSEGDFVTNYKVMTIQVPQLRADQNGSSGIIQLH